MNALRIVLVSMLLLFAGCVFIPSPYSDQLDPIGRRYSSVRIGTLRAQLESELGPPNRTAEDGLCIWETRIDERNYALLKVRFDQNGGVQKTETTRAHGQVFPRYQASAVSTRTNER